MDTVAEGADPVNCNPLQNFSTQTELSGILARMTALERIQCSLGQLLTGKLKACFDSETALRGVNWWLKGNISRHMWYPPNANILNGIWHIARKFPDLALNFSWMKAHQDKPPTTTTEAIDVDMDKKEMEFLTKDPRRQPPQDLIPLFPHTKVSLSIKVHRITGSIGTIIQCQTWED